MALFKIEKGLAANLGVNRPTAVEGYCYFTSDDGKFYIDIANGAAKTPADNQGELKGVTRMPINAYLSDKAKTADWAARALADINGNEINSHYGNSLEITDKYNLKLFAHDANHTLLSTVTLPKDVDTASKFTSSQTIKLTGAVTGEKSSQAGWEIATTLSDNIVTTSKIANNAVTNAKLANSSITIGGKSVSLGGSLTLADIGLSSALRFIGTTTTAIVDGGTTDPITIGGNEVKPTTGDVVINSNNNQEYVWLGSKWELLGDESSYALKNHTHNYAGSSSAGGAANSANKLNTNAGSSTKPVYFKNGIPEQCEDTLAVSISGDANTVDGYHGTDLVKYNDALLTVNPFGGKKLYISRIDNALYAADLRYTVTGKVYNKTSGEELRTVSCGSLFDGKYDEAAIKTSPSEILKITIDFTDTDWGFFGPYGYGYFYLSFYHTDVPDNVTARVYSNYTGHTVGWFNIPVTEISENRYPGGKIYAARNNYYKVEQIEFTFNPGSNDIRLSEIECFLDRGQDKFTTPVLNKYEPETLYYPLTAPKFIGELQGSASKVNNSLTIKLNGGTTEGTNLFTFNGSAAKSINITPAAIGASASGHKHTVTYAKATGTGSATATGTISAPKFTGTAHNHTFTGKEHNHTLTPTTATIKQVNSVGTMFAASVEGEVLILTPGSAPTTANVTVYTGLTIAKATQGGTIANTTATGTVSAPTFTGTAHSHTVTLTDTTVTSST